MTDFIESFATHQVLPPWLSAAVNTWGFAIRMDPTLIQAHLDKYFNGAYPDRAPYSYSPIPDAPFGLLVAAFHPLMWSEYPGNPPGWDAVTVTEVYLAIPVHRRPLRHDNIILDDPVVVWVQPFTWGDNASVVFGSREIWGTDMEYAVIDYDPFAGDKLHLDVATEAIKAFSPRAHSELLAVLHLEANGYSSETVEQLIDRAPDLKAFAELLGALGVFSENERPPDDPDPDIVQGGAEINHLKQFRDVFDMGAATYRAIVATETTHVNVQNFHFFDCDQVQIDFMWSDSIGELLRDMFGAVGPSDDKPLPDHPGVPQSTSAPRLAGQGQTIDWDVGPLRVKAELGFVMRSDVHFRVLETLYTYGIPPAA